MKKKSDFYNWADNNKVYIINRKLPAAKSLSLQGKNGSSYIAIDSSALSSAEEKVRIAHECGHCAKGAFYNINSPLDIMGKHEVKADKWAIPRLVSKSDLQSAVKEGYTELWQLAEYFDIPESYMKKIVSFHQNKEWH